MKLQILIGIILVVLTVITAKRQSSEDDVARKYCGKHLNQIYTMVCQSPTAGLNKRSDGKAYGWTYEDYNLDNNYEDDNNMVPIFKALGYSNPQLYERRKKQGLVDKCCYQACTILDIKDYCW